jgi:hypothetical protein
MATGKKVDVFVVVVGDELHSVHPSYTSAANTCNKRNELSLSKAKVVRGSLNYYPTDVISGE